MCESGKSYLLKKLTEPGNCIDCPSDTAICTGGSKIGPLPGYWRKNETTSNFIKCFNPSACLGMVPP
jgi:hypothetical protein